MFKKHFASPLLLLALFLSNAHASLTTNLQGLVSQGSALDANLSAFSFDQGDHFTSQALKIHSLPPLKSTIWTFPTAWR